jgi:hypothetical protein
VPSELFEHPLTDDGMFGGVMEDVDLPETQQDLAMERFPLWSP